MISENVLQLVYLSHAIYITVAFSCPAPVVILRLPLALPLLLLPNVIIIILGDSYLVDCRSDLASFAAGFCEFFCFVFFFLLHLMKFSVKLNQSQFKNLYQSPKLE